MKSRYKGNTLIELILTIGILSVIIGGFTTNYIKAYSKFRKNKIVKYTSNYIVHMIDNSIVYCKARNETGYLLFKNSHNVQFYCKNKKIEEYRFPNGIEFTKRSMRKFNDRIKIDNFGKVLTPCTIEYKYKNGESYNITIRVATRYVEIK